MQKSIPQSDLFLFNESRSFSMTPHFFLSSSLTGWLSLAMFILTVAPLRSEPIKSLFFGDSITVGQGLIHPESERWTARVAKAQGCVEINEGKGGRPSSALDEFRVALDKWKGDAGITRLVLALGGNDARDTAPDVAERVARNVGQMIDLARQAAPAWEIVICGPYNINRDQLQKKEIADLREKNLQAIGPALQMLAKAKRCPYVAFYGVIPPGSLTADGVHPDAAGHAALATAFLAIFPSTL
jgi:acyl-CoA thioesterase-1